MPKGKRYKEDYRIWEILADDAIRATEKAWVDQGAAPKNNLEEENPAPQPEKDSATIVSHHPEKS